MSDGAEPVLRFRGPASAATLMDDRLITVDRTGRSTVTALDDIAQVRLMSSLGEGICRLRTRAGEQFTIRVRPGADTPGADVVTYRQLMRELHDRLPGHVELRAGAVTQVVSGLVALVLGLVVIVGTFVMSDHLGYAYYGALAAVFGLAVALRGRPRPYPRDAIPESVLPVVPRSLQIRTRSAS